jgi:hypothetical protein
MPIFDNELINNKSGGGGQSSIPDTYLGSPDPISINRNLGGGLYTESQIAQGGLTLDQLANLAGGPDKPAGFDSSFQMIPRGELMENKRYPLYERGKDLENIYALNQSWAKQLGNSLVKFGATSLGTFAQSFATLPNTISAIKNGSLADLSNPDGYEASIDRWLKNLEDRFPNYYSRYEKNHPYLAMIPGFAGSANFWGNGVLKNLGFTVGAITGAIAQDALITLATGGIGSIPGIAATSAKAAAQIGKASLWLNKLFAGTNKIDDIITLAKGLGKTPQQLMNYEKLGQLAAATKLGNSARYALGIYGSARTEAGVEARDGFIQVKNELINQHKLENYGQEPSGADLAEIEQYAADAMNTRFGINMVLLTVSNTFQFGNLLRSFTSAQKGVTGGLVKELQDIGAVGLAKGSLDTFERKTAGTIAGRAWNKVRPTLGNVFVEGVYEEGGQFAAERGTYDYYTRKYKNLSDPKNKESWNSLNEIIDSTVYGLSEQFGTTEGVSNMIIGGITALITGGIQGRVDVMKGRGREARLQSSINILNRYGMTGILGNKYDNTLNSVGISREMQEAAASGDVFRYKNLKSDEFFNFVHSRIPTGLHDITIEQLTMLKDLSKEDFETNFGLDFSATNKQTVNEYVDSLIVAANNIKSTFDSIDKTFKNPFKSTINPKNIEEVAENKNYDIFENWKTEIAYYSTVIPDQESRLSSIERDIVRINPLLNNDILSRLTHPKSMRELSDAYMNEAQRIENSVSEITSIEEKKKTREDARTLRSNAQKINNAIKNNDAELSLNIFGDVLNFELNDRDSRKNPLITKEKVTELYEYGRDINKLKFRKERAAKILDGLVSKEGFNKFFEQEAEVTNNITSEISTPVATPSTPDPAPGEPKFKNSKGKFQKIEIGRKYETSKVKIVSVKEVGGKFQVIKSDGTVINTYDTREEAEAEMKEINEDSEALRTVEVKDLNKDGTIVVVDSNDVWRTIDPAVLNGYTGLQTEAEKIKEAKDKLDKDQADIENGVPPQPPIQPTDEDFDESTEVDGEEDKRKDESILFSSTTSLSEDWNKSADAPAHIKRSRIFLNRAKNFKNNKGELIRNKLYTILVTPNQEKALKLDGLTKLSYGGNDSSMSTDPKVGLVAAIFVEYDNGKTYYIDENGKRILDDKGNPTQVGQAVDVNKIIFQTMPTTELYYLNRKGADGKPIRKFRANQEKEAKARSRGWLAERKRLFEITDPYSLPIRKFSISRGVAKRIKIGDKFERNHVGGDNILGNEGLLVPEEVISKQEGLIEIVKNEGVSFQGRTIGFKGKNGLLVLKYEDTLEILSNSRFTDDKAKAIYQVIRAITGDILEGKDKINPLYSNFLKGLLYWKSKATASSGNQIYINTNTATIMLGGTEYAIADVVNKEDEIVAYLKSDKVYHAVDRDGIGKNFARKFIEFTADNQGNLQQIEWPNYQTYLLANKYPDGTTRSIDNTPYTTTVAKPTPDIPYSFKQKYATLHDYDIPQLPAETEDNEQPPVVTPPPPSPTKYKLNGQWETYLYKDAKGVNQDIRFKAKIVNSEVIVSDIEESDYLKSVTSNKDLISILKTKLVDELKFEKTVVSNFTDIEVIKAWIGNIIGLNIQSELNKPAPAETKDEGSPESSDGETKFKKPGGRRGNLSRVGRANNHDKRLTDDDIANYREWAAKNIPQFDNEVLDNIITINDDEKAFGQFEGKLIQFYERAPKTVPYHEAFEAVWNSFLSADDQNDIIEEERLKEGTFKDRETGEELLYSEATDSQLKENIAYEFGDYILDRAPAKTFGEKLRRFFKAIVDFFKSFGKNKSLKSDLFNAINKGKLKKAKLSEGKFSGTAYAKIPKLDETQAYWFVKDMFILASNVIFKDNNKKYLYNIDKLTSKEVFDRIKRFYIANDVYDDNNPERIGQVQYDMLVQRVKDSLRTIGIRFNDEDLTDINEEDTNSRDYAAEPFTTDWKRSSPIALKIAGMSLSKMKPIKQNPIGEIKYSEDARELSESIDGYIPLNFSQVFATTIERLHNTTDVYKIQEKMQELAREDSNYIEWFQRIGGDLKTGEFRFNEFNYYDWRFFVQFFQAFTRQKPTSWVQYDLDGDYYLGSSDTFAITTQMQKEWIQTIKALSSTPGALIKYDRTNKVYTVDSSKFPSSIPKRIDDIIPFLDSLGIVFTKEAFLKLRDRRGRGEKKADRERFLDAVISIYTHLKKSEEVATVSGKTLQIDGPFETISELYIKTTNPNQESTHFNPKGKRIQNYDNNNMSSIFENDFNSVNNVDQLRDLRRELNDPFSKNSVVLMKGGLFFDIEGNPIKNLKVETIEGKSDPDGNNGSTMAEINKGTRLVIEMNNNLNGSYYIIVPADSSTEWMINLGNYIHFDEISTEEGWNKIYKVFRGYLEDEISLARDYPNRQTLLNVGDKAKELRFFKDILSKDLLDKINEKIEDDTQSLEDILDFLKTEENIKSIHDSIRKYLEYGTQRRKEALIKNEKLITLTGKNDVVRYAMPSLDSKFAAEHDIDKYNLSEQELDNILMFVNTNYVINNTEYHKILIGDPYNFLITKTKIDETKRIKSTLSPRRTTFDHPAYNSWLNREYNKVGKIALTVNDIGHHLFKSWMNTITIDEIKVEHSLYPGLEMMEAESISWLTDNAYREAKIKNGQWPDEAEAWHQWQMAYTRSKLAEKKLWQYPKDGALEKADKITLLSAEPHYRIEVLKPIVSGTENKSQFINLIIDKFAQLPLYYKAIEGTSLEHLYLRMINSDIQYAIMNSGRRTGATELYNLYNDNGTINNEPFKGVVEVPWKIWGIQTETETSEHKEQTTGSQSVKISTADLFDKGEPIGATPERKKIIKEAYQRNLRALHNLYDNRFERLLKKLGIEDDGTGYNLKDKESLQHTLEREMLRTGNLSQNAIDSIRRDKDGNFIMPFEASTEYKTISNVLYSMVSKLFRSPKTKGSAKVQVPVTGWEKMGEGRRLIKKVTDTDGHITYEKITRSEYDKLSENEKKDVRFALDTLKFYENKDGKRYCEVMLPCWFKKELRGNKKFKSDEDIIRYLNNTKEGRKILSGIGFRIPTQAMSSMEVFVVKGFLPAFMGDTVVVPSAIVGKTGSDFDIDKLNTYLKSIYVDDKGDIRLVKYQGSKQATLDFFSDVYDKTLRAKMEKLVTDRDFRYQLYEIFNALETLPEDSSDFATIIQPLTAEQRDFYEDHSIAIENILDQADLLDMDPSAYMKQQIERAERREEREFFNSFNDEVKENYIEEMYHRSLENEYYDSLDEILTLPENFERLVSPIDDGGLKAVAEKVDKLMGIDDSTIKNKLLDGIYISELRHAFISAKDWIAIAAVSITAQSILQKTDVQLDRKKIDTLPNRYDRSILGDGIINLPHNTSGVAKNTSLSGIKTTNGKQYISGRLSGYGTAFADAPKDPYILRLIPSKLAVSTFMFLEGIGTGETGIMFMQQPIIKEFLNYLEVNDRKSLYNENDREEIMRKFPSKGIADKFDTRNFEKNITDYYVNKKLTEEQNAEQKFILKEFLKYAKMADYKFKYNQAFNYDTTRFKNGAAFNRKATKTEIAAESNIFTSIEEVLDATFLGDLITYMDRAMSAMGAILKLERDEFSSILSPIIKPYEEEDFISNDDFDRVANKLRLSFLDYIIHSKKELSSKIEELLINKDTAITKQLDEARKRHPEMVILNELIPDSQDRGDPSTETKTVKLRVNINDDQDIFTGMMRELKEVEPELYNNLIKVALLQGSYSSVVSIKNIIPVEDYAEQVRDIIDTLVVDDNLRKFAEGWFQRNNWRDDKIVPEVKPGFISPLWEEGEEIPMEAGAVDKYGNEVYRYMSPSFLMAPFAPTTEAKVGLLSKLGVKGLGNRMIMLLDEKFHYSQVKYEFVKVRRIQKRKDGTMVDMKTGKSISNSVYANLKRKGNKSIYDIYLYQRVNYGDAARTPVVTKDGKYVYKLVNALGDDRYVVEYKDSFTPSVTNNGSFKISNEIPDSDIVTALYPKLRDYIITPDSPDKTFSVQYSNKPEFNKLPSRSLTPTMTYAGIGSRETPAEIQVKMTEIAKYLSSLGYTLRSGHAKGADQAFESGATNKELFYSKDVTETTLKIAEEIHPNWAAVKGIDAKKTEYIRGLMARNTNLVFGRELDTPVDFVLAWTSDGLTHFSNRSVKSGGTGQAIDMASRKGIPVINMAKADWREQLLAVLAEINVNETPVERKGSIIRRLPDKIIGEYSGHEFSTSKLKEILKVFSKIDDTIKNGREFPNSAYDLSEYGMSDAQYKYTLENQEILDMLFEEEELRADEEMEAELTNLEDIASKLLKDNEKFTDINQTILYDEFNQLTEFSNERRTEILSNFAKKYKMSEPQALNYINEALLRDKDKVIELLKKCY